MEKEAWFERIGAENSKYVNDFLKGIIEFSKNPDYSKLFRTCGLYAVGSSVMPDRDEFNDIDITLVGLEFRAIFDYNGIFLKDPETLIEEEIILPQEKTELFKTLTHWQEFKHKGKTYHFNPEKGGRYYGHLDSFCNSKIEGSNLIKDLYRFLERNLSCEIKDLEISPLIPYINEGADYITARLVMPPSLSRRFSPEFETKKLNVSTIDFLIHGENLFVPYWKENLQKAQDLPYIILHEWEKADSKVWFDRLIPFRKLNLALPYFIDILGKKRADLKTLRKKF